MLARLSLSMLLAVSAVACATAPSAADLESADIGPKPNLEDGREAATYAAKYASLDPSSVQVLFPGDWVRGYYKEAWKEPQVSWMLPFRVNWKNKFGGYVGFVPASLHVVNDKVVAFVYSQQVDAYGTVSDRVVMATQGLTVKECGARHASVFGQLASQPGAAPVAPAAK